MSHLARSLAASSGTNQFVVRPERAVQHDDIGRGSDPSPTRVLPRQRGCNKHTFAVLLEKNPDRRLIGRSRSAKLLARVIGKRTTQRNRGASETSGFVLSVRNLTA